MKHNCSFCDKNYIENQEILGHFNNCGCGKQGILDQDINGQFYVHCFDYHICTKNVIVQMKQELFGMKQQIN